MTGAGFPSEGGVRGGLDVSILGAPADLRSEEATLAAAGGGRTGSDSIEGRMDSRVDVTREGVGDWTAAWVSGSMCVAWTSGDAVVR
jgi:hypothetical protein